MSLRRTASLIDRSLIILAFDKLGIVRRQVHQSKPLGLFSQYDGNAIGGALVGLGMSLSGSCPGTVMVQLAQGVASAKATAIGGILGGLAHVWINRPIGPKPQAPSRKPTSPLRRTISDETGLPRPAIYAAIAAALAALLYFARPQGRPFWISPAAGGLYMGFAQAVALLLTATPLGVSGVYDQVGRYVWRALGHEEVAKPASPPKAIVFALAMTAGSIALTGGATAANLPAVVSSPSALVGGFAMAFGARIAGGCTSGHGLSGLGALSSASLVSVCSMFGAGILFQQRFG